MVDVNTGIEQIILEGVILQLFGRDAKYNVPRVVLFFNKQVPPIDEPWPLGTSINGPLNKIIGEYGWRRRRAFGQYKIPAELENRLEEWSRHGAYGKNIQLKRVKKGKSAPMEINCKVDPINEKSTRYRGTNVCQLLGQAMGLTAEQMEAWLAPPVPPTEPKPGPEPERQQMDLAAKIPVPAVVPHKVISQRELTHLTNPHFGLLDELGPPWRK